MALPRVVAIVGATATGKTGLGERLAHLLAGEVVCADSRQVYRALELGTGKPEPAARALVPHHLFEALALEDDASAGWYATAAATTCAAIHGRGRVPILVGGSGLYLRAAHEGLSATPPHFPGIRARLRAESEQIGAEALHRRLAEVDPVTAARLLPRDRQRVTRALEVFEASGRPLAWWHARERGPAVAGEWRVLELTATASELEARIASRTRAMFADGLVEEVQALVEAGQEAALRRLRAIGYDEALGVITGDLDRKEAEERTSLRTRQLAKRQRTWFRHQVEAIRLPVGDRPAGDLAEAALAALA